MFARTVAASFPVTGTSAAYAYRFDPASDSFQRADTPLGPVFSEREQTVGSGKLSLATNYALLRYDSINGRDLDELISNDPESGLHYVAICLATACEPLQALARVDLEAQILTLSATYGLTPDFDLSVTVPLVRTFVRAATTLTSFDPPQHFPFQFSASATETDAGVGDVLLRLKHRLGRFGLADLAGGLTVSLPTGERENFHGTGDTLVGAALYVSRTFANRIEPHLNLGFLGDADKFDRSQVRYSIGADLGILDWLTLNNDFLGRSDIARSDPFARPVFVQVERADVLQFSTGLKIAPPWRKTFGGVPVLRDIPERGAGLPWVWFFNVLLPLNDDGARADHVLTLGAEAMF
ncbi:MAG: hypothetical protein HY699_10690 [Deltaproteobacteria bacterium]|nr:hypothetical protein [Deltaproteobacteria bacterium]